MEVHQPPTSSCSAASSRRVARYCAHKSSVLRGNIVIIQFEWSTANVGQVAGCSVTLAWLLLLVPQELQSSIRRTSTTPFGGCETRDQGQTGQWALVSGRCDWPPVSLGLVNGQSSPLLGRTCSRRAVPCGRGCARQPPPAPAARPSIFQFQAANQGQGKSHCRIPFSCQCAVSGH